MDTTFIYMDLETIPSQDDAYKANLAETLKPPANYKNEDAIAKWRADNLDDAVAKTSFDGGRGHVCTIAWAKGDDQVQAGHAETLKDEAVIIANFFADLDDYHSECLVGHYVTGFDIPFLIQRAVCLGVKLPPNTSFPRDPKPWDKNVHDTMFMFAGSKGRISMDELCDILGIPGKGEFDGSMVAAAWARGEHEKIMEYCKDDVRRTREIHKRFLAAGW